MTRLPLLHQRKIIDRSKLFTLLLILVFSSGCSFYSNGFSSFNMLDSEKRTLANKRAAQKFWSAVRPIETVSAAHYRLGRYYQQQKKHHKAIDQFSRAIQRNRGLCKAYNGIAMSYDALKKCQAAQRKYEQALQCAPDMSYLYNNYACSRMLCGDFDKGITLLKKASELDGNNDRIRNNMHLVQSFIQHKNTPKSASRSALLPENSATVQAGHHNNGKISSASGGYTLDQKPGVKDAEGGVSDTRTKIKISRAPQTHQRQSHAATAFSTGSSSPAKPAVQNTGTPGVSSAKTHADTPATITPKVNKIVATLQHNIADGSIEVSNGNGATGMAGRSAEYLRNLGFTIGRITNAEHFQFSGTIIFYKEGYLQAAQELARVVPGAQDFQLVEDLGRKYIGIRLLLGKDLVSMHFPDDYFYKQLAGIMH